MLLIVDDFLENPEKVRELAIGMKFDNRIKSLPGLRSTKLYRPREIKERVAALSLPAWQRNEFQYKEYKFDCGFFQFFGDRQRKSYIHCDIYYKWHGIIFLSHGPKTEFYPGTSFYQHRRTGLSQVDVHSAASALQNIIDPEKQKKIHAEAIKDRYNFAKWRHVMTVAARWNRLILFRTDYYHVNASRWGTSPANGRLTYNFGLK